MKMPTFLLLIGLFAAGGTMLHATGPSSGQVVTERFTSSVLQENLIGLNPERAIKVYLPPGYANSGKAYPVVYFCHSLNWSAEQAFADGNMAKRLERAFATGVVGEFILVAADYTTPTMGSLYENSPVTGRWIDYTVQEVVPLIDRKFRTLRHRDSRAVIGDFMGGRGALQLVMAHADVFGSAYALHPVATGAGSLPVNYLEVDWTSVHRAKSYSELPAVGRNRIFLMICQSFLSNPSRPPLYCDFPLEQVNGELRIHAENSRKLQRAFHLDESLDAAVENLRSLRGLAFDWGRYDPTPAHVLANQTFARKLADLGIRHEAEEFSGNPWDQYWGEEGRLATRVLPFLKRHLVFEGN